MTINESSCVLEEKVVEKFSNILNNCQNVLNDQVSYPMISDSHVLIIVHVLN